MYADGYRSIAICFVHSYTYPEHELVVGDIASSIGFEHVSMSAQLLPMIKLVPRGVSATADAYLTPVLMSYLDGFFSGFDAKLRQGGPENPRVEFMGSDGGLLDLQNFSGLKSILSGPAGGVVGFALTSWDEERKQAVIGCAELCQPSRIALMHPQNRYWRHFHGRFAFCRSLRDCIRNNYSWRDHTITPA